MVAPRNAALGGRKPVPGLAVAYDDAYHTGMPDHRDEAKLDDERLARMESIRARWGGVLPPMQIDEPFPITCDACSEAKCAICGHEPCPCCVDCCDHDACLVEDRAGLGGGGDPTELVKTHECRFTPCDLHRGPC